MIANRLPRRCVALQVLAAVLFLASQSPAAEYWVAAWGDDDNAGNQESPFRTLQHAAALLQAGDSCHIRGGTYRETVTPAHSGRPGAPIRFVASEGERVVVSGADELEGVWQAHQNGIYLLEAAADVSQLFLDGHMMNEARWPNAAVDGLLHMPRAEMEEGSSHDALVDNDLPPGAWDGATVLFWPGKAYNSYTRTVAAYEPGRQFRFDPPMSREIGEYAKFDRFAPKAGNKYVLYGALAGLDAPGEWYHDAETQTLYLKTPDGDAPAVHIVEAKRRDWAFNLASKHFIHIEGITVFAAAVDLDEAQACRVENCRVLYPNHAEVSDGRNTDLPTNRMGGTENVWRRCEIAYAAGGALEDYGTANRVENCIIHDIDHLGTGRGGIGTRASRSVYERNTIYNGGRILINHKDAKGIRIVYNHLYNAGLLTQDCGVTKTGWCDGQGTEIAYNWVHDNKAKVGEGIYLDNFCKGFVIHHNVAWSNAGAGIRLNGPCEDTRVYNNTVLDNRWSFNTFTHQGYDPDQSTVQVINNLCDGEMIFSTGRFAPEAHHNGEFDLGKDFVPIEGSGAIDSGIAIGGFTDGFIGQAPDVGAYERGAPVWIPGADWSVP